MLIVEWSDASLVTKHVSSPIDFLSRGLVTLTTYPIRCVVQVVLYVTASSISFASVGQVTFESDICPVNIFHPSGAGPYKKEAVEKVQRNISALLYVTRAELPE